MKKTEQLTFSEITGTIYWADVRPIKGQEDYVECVGEKKDVTKQAIKAVYEHFLYKAQESPDGVYGVKFGDGPWLNIKLPPIRVTIDGVQGEVE